MNDLDEELIDNEPFDGEASIQEAGDTASPEAQMAERRAFEQRVEDPVPKSDVQRHLERGQPAPPAPVAPPAPAAMPLEAVERVIERVLERVVPRQEPVAPPPAPPEPTLVERFDRDPEFYRAAMEQAGYTPNEKGEFTREGMTAVRAHLRLADREAEVEKRFNALEQQRVQERRMEIVSAAEARLSSFEPLSETQARLFGRALGDLTDRGVPVHQALEATIKDFGGLLRPKAPAAPAPVRGQTRRAPSPADRVIATPGMRQTAGPALTPEERLSQSRRAMAEKLMGGPGRGR